jgi:hypothetical protein
MKKKIARLSSVVPLMDQLHVIYAIIWQNLNLIVKQFVVIENQLHYVKVPFEMTEDGLLKMYVDQEKQNEITVETEIKNNLIKISVDQQYEFIFGALQESLKELITEENVEKNTEKNTKENNEKNTENAEKNTKASFKKLKIPKCFLKYAQQQISKLN